MYLLAKIYRDGFFTKADDDFCSIAASDLGMSKDKIGQMIHFFLGRSLLDSTLFEADKVITSSGIQRRYQEAVKKRASKRAVIVDGRYWLLKPEDTEPFIQIRPFENKSEINPSKSEKNPSKSAINTTKERKVKESKVKESRVEENPAAPSAQKVKDDLIAKYGKSMVEAYISKAMSYSYTGDKAIYKAAQWMAEDKVKPQKETSFDLEEYEEMERNYTPKIGKDG